MFNYNTFHHKNVNIQKKLIGKHNYTYQSLIMIIRDFFTIKNKNTIVLDLGCGVGTIDFYLAKMGYKVIGIDVSSRAIKLANNSKKELKLDNINFVCSKLEHINENVKYDYIILSEVIEHVDNPSDVLRKINMILKHDGLLVLSTPLNTAPLFRLGLLDDFDREVGHVRRYSKTELFFLLEREGFCIVKKFETEGLIRNLLYTTKPFGVFLKFMKWPITIFVNAADDFVRLLFGPSNLYVICRKK